MKMMYLRGRDEIAWLDPAEANQTSLELSRSITRLAWRPLGNPLTTVAADRKKLQLAVASEDSSVSLVTV